MFRACFLPSSGTKNCTRSLWFNCWREVVGALLVVDWQTCQTTTNIAPNAMLQQENQKLLVQLYNPVDGRGDARNMCPYING
jgi:ribosome modulation factor